MKFVFIFLSGLFFANGIPHFINGISGRRFHSPFAKPFVKGLSSPVSNVIWGSISFILALVFRYLSDDPVFGFNLNSGIFSLGFILTSIGLSIFFYKLDN